MVSKCTVIIIPVITTISIVDVIVVVIVVVIVIVIVIVVIVIVIAYAIIVYWVAEKMFLKFCFKGMNRWRFLDNGRDTIPD